MDDETRSAIRQLRDEMRGGFARIERWFELSQAQHLEFRASTNLRFDRVDQRFDGMDQRFDALETEFSVLRSEFRSFRDWATGQVGEVKLRLRELTARVDAVAQG